MDGFTTAIRKYAQFYGRSRRREFWGFYLVNLLFSLVFSALIFTIGYDRDAQTYTVIGWILVAIAFMYGLFVLLPALGVQWRRYQDVGWPGPLSILGWFFPLLTFIVAFLPGTAGPNQYGPDPKA